MSECPRSDAPGAGLQAYHLTGWLKHDHLLFITRTGPQSRGRPVDFPAHVKLVDLRLWDFYLSEDLRPRWTDLPRYALKAWVLGWFLMRAIPHLLRFRPEVVHVHAVTDFPLGVFARCFLGARLLVTFHGTELRRLREWPVVARCYRRFADAVSYVSEDMAADVRALFPQRPVIHTPTGVDLETFARERPKRNEIITVGRLRWQKGYPQLLEAMRVVFAHHPGYRLVIVGDGPMRADIEAAMATAPLAGRVDLVPCLDREELAERMAAAQLFVLASLSEGMPKVVMEALAAGTPVVTTRVGGAPDAVGPCGAVVEPGRADALAQAIMALLDAPARLVELGAQARQRALAFGWEQRLQPFAELLRHLAPWRRR